MVISQNIKTVIEPASTTVFIFLHIYMIYKHIMCKSYCDINCIDIIIIPIHKENGSATTNCSQSILKWAAGGSNPAHPD